MTPKGHDHWNKATNSVGLACIAYTCSNKHARKNVCGHVRQQATFAYRLGERQKRKTDVVLIDS